MRQRRMSGGVGKIFATDAISLFETEGDNVIELDLEEYVVTVTITAKEP